MGSWLFWGVVLLGGVLVGLGVGQMVRRKKSASNPSKQVHRINSITDSMQVKRIRKSSSVTQNTEPGPPPIGEDWDIVGLDRKPQSQKSEANRPASFRPPVNSAAPSHIMWGREAHPGAKQPHKSKSVYKRPDHAPPKPPSPNEIDPAFEQTQIKRVRRRKSTYNHPTVVSNLESDNVEKQTDIRTQTINNHPAPLPNQQPDRVDEHTAIKRPPRLTKPSSSSKDFPN